MSLEIVLLPTPYRTKALTVQQRAQARDYIDIDALLRHGVGPAADTRGGGSVVYGSSFNPLLTLKALSYFDDVASLPAEVRERLQAAVASVDPSRLPRLTPHVRRNEQR